MSQQIEKDLNEVIKKLKSAIKKEYDNQCYEGALRLISVCSNILYVSNQYYMDEDLEYYIEKISEQMLGVEIPVGSKENVILFYDGFGLNSRGLVQIYVKALSKLGKLIYVVDQSQKDCIPDVINIIEKNKGNIFFLPGRTLSNKVHILDQIIEEQKPQHLFMYARPDDVIVTTVFFKYKKLGTRYQINLTDHAFWLGKNSFDFCIEFRDYGAFVSNTFRKIDKTNIVKLPFYPMIDRSILFKGYPFEKESEGKKIVFSGGALYKTLGGNNKYYKIVEYILDTKPDSLFWYAGTGDTTEIQKLIDKYPERVFLTNERKDFFQILERSFVYLSTYPMAGGLMFQYAASAGKIPLTLRHNNDADGFLINQSNLGIEFENVCDLEKEIDTIFNNPVYKLQKEIEVSKSVMNEDSFTEQLQKLLQYKNNDLDINYFEVDCLSFRKEYLSRLNSIQLNMQLFRKNDWILLKYFPLRFLIGMFYKTKRLLNYKLTKGGKNADS